MRPFIAELSRVADTLVAAYPNAGLPNAIGQYDEEPQETRALHRANGRLGPGQHRRRLLRHHAGAHPAIAEDGGEGLTRARGPERPVAHAAVRARAVRDGRLMRPTFVNVGERTNVTGSARFRKLITDGDYDRRPVGRAPAGRGGAQVIDVNMDEGLLDRRGDGPSST
jgi:5-methyltetrahydrofolate--homocysteine methyltransferase